MSSISTPGTFQLSTDQVIVSNSTVADQSGLSRSINVGTEEYRVDYATGHSPHFRAIQLDQFTSWLNIGHRIVILLGLLALATTTEALEPGHRPDSTDGTTADDGQQVRCDQ